MAVVDVELVGVGVGVGVAGLVFVVVSASVVVVVLLLVEVVVVVDVLSFLGSRSGMKRRRKVVASDDRPHLRVGWHPENPACSRSNMIGSLSPT